MTTQPMPYTEAEMDDAVRHLLDRLTQLATRTGRPVGEYIEADPFALHAMAYVLALREPAPADTLHGRALARYVELLAHGPDFDTVSDRLITDTYTAAPSPALRPVTT